MLTIRVGWVWMSIGAVFLVPTLAAAAQWWLKAAAWFMRVIGIRTGTFIEPAAFKHHPTGALRCPKCRELVSHGCKAAQR